MRVASELYILFCAFNTRLQHGLPRGHLREHRGPPGYQGGHHQQQCRSESIDILGGLTYHLLHALGRLHNICHNLHKVSEYCWRDMCEPHTAHYHDELDQVDDDSRLCYSVHRIACSRSALTGHSLHNLDVLEHLSLELVRVQVYDVQHVHQPLQPSRHLEQRRASDIPLHHADYRTDDDEGGYDRTDDDKQRRPRASCHFGVLNEQ